MKFAARVAKVSTVFSIQATQFRSNRVQSIVPTLSMFSRRTPFIEED